MSTSTPTSTISNKAINPLFGQCTEGAATCGSQMIAILLARLFSAGLGIGMIAFLGYFVYGAYSWMMAGGDSSKIQAAREALIQAVIGMVLLASVFAIANLIAPILGLSNDNCTFPQEICWPTF